MTQNSEFIEFSYSTENQFSDCQRAFQLLRESREQQKRGSHRDWVKQFPEYALREFNFVDANLKPEGLNIDQNSKAWHFEDVIDYLQAELEVDLLTLEKISDKRGILRFYAQAYPYGGISVMIEFLRSFGCIADKAFEGAYYLKINWQNKYEFECKEVKPAVSGRKGLLSRLNHWFNKGG